MSRSRWEIELEKMAEKIGHLTPEAVVEKARNPNTALHAMFEWDDGEAAEQYRLLQARGLIRRVVVHVTRPTETETVTVRAFVNVERGSTEYVPIRVVQSDEAATAAVIHHLLADLRSVQQRLARYADYLDASDELRASIDRFVARNEKARKRA